MSAACPEKDLVRLSVAQVLVDPQTGVPSMILKEECGRRCVSLAIGVGEVQALQAGLGEVELLRPLPHDLLKNLLQLSGMTFVHTEICRSSACGYEAKILVRSRTGELFRLEARPSDAVALALRMGGPILIAAGELSASRWVETPPAPLSDGVPGRRSSGSFARFLPPRPSWPPRRPKWRM